MPTASDARLARCLDEPAAAIVSGLPLLTKPMRTRIRLINEAFGLMQAERAVRPVHLFDDDAADPEGPVARRRAKPPSASG